MTVVLALRLAVAGLLGVAAARNEAAEVMEVVDAERKTATAPVVVALLALSVEADGYATTAFAARAAAAGVVVGL